MFKTTFDPSRPLTYVVYARMSSDQQNPRSPDQQFDNIAALIRRQGRPWRKIGSYRDDGVSGRYTRARRQYQQMLKDIESGRIKPDLILVDTLDRFGRNDEVPEIRRKLEQRYGVVILTVDSGFADPTTPSGQVMGVVDAIRGREENRVKAHMVGRGKRDAARERHWPGGPPPFGYRIEYVYREYNGRQEVDYSRLVVCPETSWIVVLAFEKAVEFQWGMTRLASFLNEHPDIPNNWKPFSFSTVGRWLANRIYYGALVWDKVSTGLVDDRRVSKRNPTDEQTVVEDFCDGIVSRELWEQVAILRKSRQIPKDTQVESGAIAVVSRRLAMRYPFTGIARCGECGRSMVPNGSAKYTDRLGQEHRYVRYLCPGMSDKTCSNRMRVPEEWVRVTAIQLLLKRLGICDSPDATQVRDQLIAELHALVIAELERLSSQEPSNINALHEEASKLQRQIEGWGKSLACPDLPATVRQELAKSWESASIRLTEIQGIIEIETQRRQDRDITFNLDELNEGIAALPDLVSGENATIANFRLSLHFRAIECYRDGRVRFAISKLGILPNLPAVVDRIRTETDIDTERYLHRARRRGRLATPSLLSDDDELMEFATDPHRFNGIPEQFFWCEELYVPIKRAWVEEYAEEVYFRRQNGDSIRSLCERYDRSRPTIRQAIKIALQRRREQGLAG